MKKNSDALIIITLLVSSVVLIFGGHPWWAGAFLFLSVASAIFFD